MEVREDFDFIIEANSVEKRYWLDLWAYRELLFFLSWRDLIVRYKQTILGVAWSLLRPLLTTISFVIVFQKVAQLDSGGVPYPVLVLSALIPWQLFSTTLMESSNSLIANSNLLTKVYFPRIIVPLSSVMICLVDTLFSFILLVGFMVYYQMSVGPNIFLIPFFILLAVGCATGAGLFLSALNVRYRDFRYIVPFVVQIGLYLSPVGFSSEIVPSEWRSVYSLNPMVGIIDGFRWCLFSSNTTLPTSALMSSMVFTVLLLVLGVKYFRRMEKTFADRI